MIDLAVLVERWVEPAGRVDHDAVLGAMSRELGRLLDEGVIVLPDEGPIRVPGLRLDAGLVPLDRQADPADLGAALARLVIGALRGPP
jgi:hypothetical protein